MVSMDLPSCHEVFYGVAHSVGIAIASVTLVFLLSLIFLLIFTIFLCLSMDVKTHLAY